MSRDDGMLYSGLSSASLTPTVSVKQQKRKAEKAQERLAQKREVQTNIDPILAIVDKYKQAASHVLLVASSETVSDKEAGEIMRSQRRVYATLVNLETDIRKILKEPV